MTTTLTTPSGIRVVVPNDESAQRFMRLFAQPRQCAVEGGPVPAINGTAARLNAVNGSVAGHGVVGAVVARAPDGKRVRVGGVASSPSLPPLSRGGALSNHRKSRYEQA